MEVSKYDVTLVLAGEILSDLSRDVMGVVVTFTHFLYIVTIDNRDDYSLLYKITIDNRDVTNSQYIVTIDTRDYYSLSHRNSAGLSDMARNHARMALNGPNMGFFRNF